MTELELRAHKIEAIGAIENLMSMHTYYHAACFNREELENCWSQERDEEVVWCQNWGRWKGYTAKLMPLYAGDNKYVDAAWLKKKIVRAHPELAEALEKVDGRGLQEMPTHVLASPVIHIAEDGMSAKGLWYTPGYGMRHDHINGTASVGWMWEKYGGDFIYENGEWRFLRLLICMDGDPETWCEPPKMFFNPEDFNPDEFELPEDFAPPGGDAAPDEPDPDDPDGKRGKSPAFGGMFSVPPDEPGPHQNFSPTRIPSEMPRIPEPFESLETTWSY